jgi:hypothetical protein
MDFWIVAIDHKLQLAKRVNDLPKTAALKEQLEAILKEEIPKRHVRFIAEESKIGEVTIAAAIGDASDPKIPWVNISMSDTERAAAGIAQALDWVDDSQRSMHYALSLQNRLISIISSIEPAAALPMRGSATTIARHFARDNATLTRLRSRMKASPRDPYSP